MNTCTYMYLVVPSGKECVHKEGAESPGVADEVIVFFFYPSSLPSEHLMFSLPTY